MVVHHPNLSSRASALAIALVLLVLLAVAAPAANGKGAWTRTIAPGLSAGELGLPAGTSAQRLARAALRRESQRLGLARSLRGVRLDRRQHVPGGADGAAPLELLRFHQTVAGVRVLWSQIDVTIAAGRVSSISATAVPIAARRLARHPEVSRAEALRIARRAVTGREQALTPLRVAYAGKPTVGKAKARTARLAWVVEVTPVSAGEAEASTPLCIIVSAKTGQVIGRWRGIADRPDRGPNARGAAGPIGTARATGTVTQLLVGNGTNGGSGAPVYARYNVTGDPRLKGVWPSYVQARVAPTNTVMDMASANAANVARTICELRGYCGQDGGFRDRTSTYSGTVTAWQLAGNTPAGSRTRPSTLLVELAREDVMGLNSANDVVAHEMGHIMDWSYAGDRDHSSTENQAGEVQEALADMFAYEYDRFDATIAEESDLGVSRNIANPSDRNNRHNLSFPNHMSEYDPFRSSFPHYNSTILSHAYYRLVQAVGHPRAGRLLHNVPSFLSPRPTFKEVANAFYHRAFTIYGGEVTSATDSAFRAVGLPPRLIGKPCLPSCSARNG